MRRRIIFNGIELIPVDTNDFPWCMRRDKYADSWHVPGGEIVRTKNLVRRAKARGVQIMLQESVGARSTAVSLI